MFTFLFNKLYLNSTKYPNNMFLKKIRDHPASSLWSSRCFRFVWKRIGDESWNNDHGETMANTRQFVTEQNSIYNQPFDLKLVVRLLEVSTHHFVGKKWFVGSHRGKTRVSKVRKWLNAQKWFENQILGNVYYFIVYIKLFVVLVPIIDLCKVVAEPGSLKDFKS